MRDIYLLYLIKTLNDNEILNEETLSSFLIDLDRNGFTLTRIISDIEGLATPRLKQKMDEYIIYRIIDQGSSLRVTDEGKEYIEKKISTIAETPDYKEFSAIVHSLLPNFIKK